MNWQQEITQTYGGINFIIQILGLHKKKFLIVLKLNCTIMYVGRPCIDVLTIPWLNFIDVKSQIMFNKKV
jgi:hypothetical protein